MGSARRRQERVLEHLTRLRELPMGGAPEPAFRERLRAELMSGPTSALGSERAPAGSSPGSSAGSSAGSSERIPVSEGAGGRARRRGAPRHARVRARVRPAPRRPLLSHLAALGLVAMMMVAAFGTYRAVPGDSLYPLKRAAESTLVRLSTDDAERGERELNSAKARAEEVATLLGSSGRGPLVGKTLTDMEKSTRAGISRLERAEPRSPKIRKFARDQKEMVRPMLPRLDEAEQAQAEDYLTYIEGLVAPR
ncbi:MAG TPA: DUF5667 domain-containing protein [Nonomuraea sp.]|nr:DUF5667 domain-containing protein [Nonomuraea sp.]